VNRLLLLISLVGVVVAVVVVVVVVVNQSGKSVAAEAPCSEIDVGFTTDEAMAKVAAELKGDRRVVDPVGETKQQGYERYQKTFAGDRELLNMVSPETYPANVRLKPAPGISRNSLKAELKQAYPEALVQDPCLVPTIRPAT
jgi:hypothetical protein